jgi:hypothetical protein
MSVINTRPLAGASGNQVTGYNLTKSLRFRQAATAYLSRTPASAGNRQKFTWSGWVKRGKIGQYQPLFCTGNVFGQQIANIGFSSAGGIYDKLELSCGVQNVSTESWTQSPALYRDPSAWYHIIVSVDTTQATSTNRVKFYVNGTQLTGLGAYSTYASQPSQNYSSSVNNTVAHRIGSEGIDSLYYDGYLSEVNFIDGQQLDSSSFGEFDSITGVWKPKRYTGTYGTNGFYLPFTDVATTSGSNAGLGKDFSGNGNYWTTNNISVTAGENYDSMSDVPTLTSATAANYATLNPLVTNVGSSNTFFYGNLELGSNSNSVNSFAPSTISMTSGKYYFEAKVGRANATTGMTVGVYKLPILNGTNFYSQPNYRYYSVDGKVYDASAAVQNYSTYTDNNIIGVALDLDNGKVFFSKNGTWQGSSDPAAGTNPAATGLTGEWAFGLNVGNTTNDWAFANFGQQGFVYTPPTGFKALNTFNLPDSTIVAGNKYMDATTYTGNGSTQTITNAGGFKPDLVWIKNRTGVYNHRAFDSIRGATKILYPNATDAELTDANSLTSFNSNGFSLGSAAGTNNNTDSFVGWQWQAGQGSSSSNTSGSITSTVSVNASAGFSIVTYTGSGIAATVGHGLGVAPKFILVKDRNNAQDWRVYTSSTGAGNVLFINASDASTADTTAWNNTAPTSSVFSLGTSLGTNFATRAFIAYCWSEIAGFSKFGSYTGNGSTDGTFVYTGFRPKFVLIKRTDASQNWALKDTTRDPSNVSSKSLFAQLSDSEYDNSSNYVDILSNGFKIRTTDTGYGASGGTYIYMAFAENPFKNSLAR